MVVKNVVLVMMLEWSSSSSSDLPCPPLGVSPLTSLVACDDIIRMVDARSLGFRPQPSPRPIQVLRKQRLLNGNPTETHDKGKVVDRGQGLSLHSSEVFLAFVLIFFFCTVTGNLVLLGRCLVLIIRVSLALSA